MRHPKARKKSQLYMIVSVAALIIIAVLLVRPLLVPVTSVPAAGSAQPAVIKRPVNPYITSLLTDYEREMKTLHARSRTPGAAIAVVYDSVIVYEKGFGVRATNSTQQVDENTVFRIASVSKCFSSFLTGILIEDGVLTWSDPVVQYLPGFQLKSEEQTRKLNISHVLSHTTGLPYHTYTNLVEEGLDLQTLLASLKDVNLSNDVGLEYSYQNVAYSLIGEVIGKATGQSFEAQMKDKVFGPLGMKNASMDYASLITNGNIARPHRLANRRWVPTRINDTYYNVSPAGGINASISDMAAWMKALLGHRTDVISQATLNHMYTPAIQARSKNRNYGKAEKIKRSFYGLGWRILHYESDTIVYHGGYVNGYRSEVAIDQQDKIAICILANAPGGLADNGIPIFFNLYKRYRKSILDWEARNTVPL